MAAENVRESANTGFQTEWPDHSSQKPACVVTSPVWPREPSRTSEAGPDMGITDLGAADGGALDRDCTRVHRFVRVDQRTGHLAHSRTFSVCKAGGSFSRIAV